MTDDIHRTTAARMFNVCYEEVTDEQRKIAKRRNFQHIYGVPESPESQRHTDALWVALSGIRRSTTSWGHIGGGTRRGI